MASTKASSRLVSDATAKGSGGGGAAAPTLGRRPAGNHRGNSLERGARRGGRAQGSASAATSATVARNAAPTRGNRATFEGGRPVAAGSRMQPAPRASIFGENSGPDRTLGRGHKRRHSFSAYRVRLQAAKFDQRWSTGSDRDRKVRARRSKDCRQHAGSSKSDRKSPVLAQRGSGRQKSLWRDHGGSAHMAQRQRPLILHRTSGVWWSSSPVAQSSRRAWQTCRSRACRGRLSLSSKLTRSSCHEGFSQQLRLVMSIARGRRGRSLRATCCCRRLVAETMLGLCRAGSCGLWSVLGQRPWGCCEGVALWVGRACETDAVSDLQARAVSVWGVCSCEGPNSVLEGGGRLPTSPDSCLRASGRRRLKCAPAMCCSLARQPNQRQDKI